MSYTLSQILLELNDFASDGFVVEIKHEEVEAGGEGGEVNVIN